MSDAGLTIGQLAERTGAAAGTLRMWESRYGFPRARRLASGHRRYSEEDVERVRDVAATGENMPPKSTYFYPKIPTGLVFNLLR